MKKALLIFGGVILVIIVITAIGGSSNKGENQPTTANNNQTTTTPTPAPEKINVRDLADDFDGNQVAAEAKWKGKLIEFSAPISNITDSGLSFTNVASKQFSMTQISCKIGDKQQLLPLKNGQTVTVRGVIGTQIIGVIDMSKCEVVNQ